MFFNKGGTELKFTLFFKRTFEMIEIKSVKIRFSILQWVVLFITLYCWFSGKLEMLIELLHGWILLRKT